MRINFPSGDEAATLTDAQRASVAKVAERFELAEPITVHPEFCGAAVMVQATSTLWLGIETDGYTHS